VNRPSWTSLQTDCPDLPQNAWAHLQALNCATRIPGLEEPGELEICDGRRRNANRGDAYNQYRHANVCNVRLTAFMWLLSTSMLWSRNNLLDVIRGCQL
jgi:hypothetical protein